MADLMYVEWEDSVSTGELWSDRASVEKLTPQVTKSVGWVLKETPAYITLISHDGMDEVGGDIVIPKVSIIRQVELDGPDE